MAKRKVLGKQVTVNGKPIMLLLRNCLPFTFYHIPFTLFYPMRHALCPMRTDLAQSTWFPRFD
jgi:hypothetical protein